MRSQEGKFSTGLVKALNELPNSYFRKVSDRVQIGIPDIIGCLAGRHVEIEVKHEDVMMLDNKRRPLGPHPFTGAQRKELAHSAAAGGASIGIIACGPIGWAFPAWWIEDDGRVCFKDFAGLDSPVNFTLPSTNIRLLAEFIKKVGL